MKMLNAELLDDLCVKAETQKSTPKMKRIPPLLRLEEHNKCDFDPKVVSFGPYHHGEPDLQLGEFLKRNAMEVFLSGSGRERAYFYDRILGEIDEIRDCYDGVSRDQYDDASLAEMMMIDGCFAVFHMEVLSDSEKLVDALHCVGMVGFSFTHRDMLLLENQIPYRVITLLISLRYDVVRGKDLLDKFLNFSAFHESAHERSEKIEHEGPPLNLLDAVRRQLVSELYRGSFRFRQKRPRFSILQWITKRKQEEDRYHVFDKKQHHQVNLKSVYTSRSVKELKAKGIYFRPSPSCCLKDVTFQSIGILCGQLNLPVRFVSSKTKVLFSNLIAYEICPNNATDYAISSYVNLMKSLIHSTKDVKELREKRILISNLGSDDEVLKVFKEMHTYGMENAGIFYHVKEKIEEHYNSNARTWMAELIHTYFESPWNAIALLAGIVLLIMTYVQTYFTIHPPQA